MHHRLDSLADSMARSLAGRGTDQPIVVLAAVSGGADSTFLLHMLHRALQDTGCAVHACYVDHGYRQDSTADSAFVESLAARLKLPFHGLELPAPERPPDRNRQAWWREGRYRLLATTARSLAGTGQTAAIATGHHAGDQVETLLMNLIRGTHLAGLRGMEEWSTLFGHAGPDTRDDVEVLLWRPLLAWTPEAIRNCLGTWGETWIEDSSNRDESHTRNRIRHRLVPQLANLRPDAVAFLAHQMELWRPDLLALERLHADRLERAALPLGQPDMPSADPPVIISLQHLRSSPPWQQRGLLAQAVFRLRRNRQLSAARLLELCRQLHAADGSCHSRRWFGDLCWSVWHRPPERMFDLPTDDDLLSLHKHGASPFPVAMPRLPSAWHHGPIPLDTDSALQLPDWTLSGLRCEPAASMTALRDDASPWSVCLDLACLKADCNSLRLGWAIPHLKLRPAGMQTGSKRIHRILRDGRVHASLRSDWPVVYTDGGDPVWVCGLRHAARYAVRKPERPVLRLRWHRNP